MQEHSDSTIAPAPTVKVSAPAKGKLEWRKGDSSAAVDENVRSERTRARGLGRKLLVYVGATWCEPCQRFHHAVEKGELDNAFPDLTIVEFDSDRDGPRLARAGYQSGFIPLFALPGEDGRSTEKRIEGSIKGEGSIGDLTRKLHTLID